MTRGWRCAGRALDLRGSQRVAGQRAGAALCGRSGSPAGCLPRSGTGVDAARRRPGRSHESRSRVASAVDRRRMAAVAGCTRRRVRGSSPGVCTWLLVVRGPAGQVLVNAANRATDLLVIGAGRRGPRRLAGGRVSRYCLAQARCPVLAIPPAALAREAECGLRGWAFRHRRLHPAAYIRLSAPGSTRPPLRTGGAARGAAELRRIQSERPRCPGGLLFKSSHAGQSHRAASQD
jgi:nucleotide-binding universal stress UspA family protein